MLLSVDIFLDQQLHARGVGFDGDAARTRNTLTEFIHPISNAINQSPIWLFVVLHTIVKPF